MSTDVVEAVVRAHGGMKFYRGAAKAARAYVERDRSRADDYYLGDGTGVAVRLTATPDGVERAGAMDGETYEQWVSGVDVDTGHKKGRVRDDANALRFVEVTVNGPKTWSLAAALHPDISAALDEAQDKAATEIVGWVAGHATTRVGPRGRQVQVPVEQIEAAAIRHYASRAGDPHRHLHLQINARVYAAGAWRGIHSVGIRDSIEAINGIGHAAVAAGAAGAGSECGSAPVMGRRAVAPLARGLSRPVRARGESRRSSPTRIAVRRPGSSGAQTRVSAHASWAHRCSA